MGAVELSKKELVALDSMIERLKEQGSARTTNVPLRDLADAMLTTVVIDATKIVTSGTRILPEDAKVLSEVGSLIAKLQSKVTLADLLDLRERTLGKRKSP